MIYLIRTLIGAYGLGVLGVLGGRIVIGETWTVIAFFNAILDLVLFPSLVLLPLALLLRQRFVATLMLPPILALVGWYAPLLVVSGSVQSAEDAASRLSLVSYNVNGHNDDFEAIATVLREMNADVVVLQELGPALADYLLAAIGDDYPFNTLQVNVRHAIYGEGVLSRHEIVESSTWMGELGGNQRVLIQVGDGQVAVYNIHAAYPFVVGGFDSRRRDVSTILELAAAETVPVILAGDFNLTPRSEDYDRLVSTYVDVHAAVGSGLGYTFTPRFSPIPLARIDYIFVDERLTPLRIRVGSDTGGSDHSPVWVTITGESE